MQDGIINKLDSMKKNIFLGIALMALLNSCTDKFDENRVQNPVQVGDEILFGSSISGDGSAVESRTVYGDRTDTGIPVYWKENGDEIAIFCPQASQPADKLVTYLVKPQMDDNGKPTNGSASVTAKVDPGEAGLQWGNAPTHRFYAFYPAKSVKGTENDGKIKSNIPVEQNVTEWRDSVLNGVKTHFGLPNMDLAYMYACDSVITAEMDRNDPIELKFHNLLTVLDITIPGPATGSDPIIVTAVNVEAVNDKGQAGHEPILTGDFYCYLRDGIEEHKIGDCEPVNPEPTEVSNRIAISTYNPATKKFIQVGPGEQINVKAYILPHTDEVIEKQSLKISVVTMNGAPKTKKLQKRQIVPGKINRVRLPYLEQSNETNYWMSNLDPNVYFTELSLPGSHQSVGTDPESHFVGWDGWVTYEQYQNKTLAEQFTDGVRAFHFQTRYHAINNNINVFACGQDYSQLYVYLKQLADVLEGMPEDKKEFVVVNVGFKSSTAATDENEWYNTLAGQLKENSNYTSLPIYKDGIDANTTIEQLARKIVLRIDRQGTTSVPALISAQPNTTEAPAEKDMYWGSTNNGRVLTMYAQDATSIKVSGNCKGELADMSTKLGYMQTIFSESVNKYKENNAHDYLYYMNIGGFYCNSKSNDAEGGDVIKYTEEITPQIIDYVQKRGDDASLGLVMMNFADKQPGSGAKYGCDGLIQTIIYNNFSFALRKKPGTTTPTRTEYVTRMSSDENQWDE